MIGRGEAEVIDRVSECDNEPPHYLLGRHDIVRFKLHDGHVVEVTLASDGTEVEVRGAGNRGTLLALYPLSGNVLRVRGA